MIKIAHLVSSHSVKSWPGYAEDLDKSNIPLFVNYKDSVGKEGEGCMLG